MKDKCEHELIGNHEETNGWCQCCGATAYDISLEQERELGALPQTKKREE